MLQVCVQTAIVVSSRDDSFPRTSSSLHITFLDARSSILDSRVSKLERLDVRDARIEFRGSSRDCQLTFERYCSFMSRTAITLKFKMLLLPNEARY